MAEYQDCAVSHLHPFLIHILTVSYRGNSTSFNALNKVPAQSIVQKFNGLSTTAKIGIAAGVGGGVLLLAILCTFCCVRQRRVGRRERNAADADWDRANSEMLAFKESQFSVPAGHSPNPYNDSRTELSSYGVPSHGGYNMVSPGPNTQYAPHQQQRF